MHYPRYMFVTSVPNVGRWWEVVEEEDQCTPEELESILHYTLAVTQQFDFHHDPNATTDTGIVSVPSIVLVSFQEKNNDSVSKSRLTLATSVRSYPAN